MEVSERITVIQQIARQLASQEWYTIDLILRQFGLPWSDSWSGNNKEAYVVEMIESADEETLLKLAQHLGIRVAKQRAKLSPQEIQKLLGMLEKQKSLMIAVATGKKLIPEVNEEYIQRRREIKRHLDKIGIEDPNPFGNLWAWYHRWKEGDLPTYSSRRVYIAELYQPLEDTLTLLLDDSQNLQIEVEPTGWPRVDRGVEKIVQALLNASNEEDFQTVGLLCRETIISLAQAVYDPSKYLPLDGVIPSEADAKRMLEAFIAYELPGKGNEELRKFAKAAYQLAVSLQHRRTANFKDAALCVEATRALVNVVAIISGRRAPNITEAPVDEDETSLEELFDDELPF